jgi:hypothetical protein
MALSHLFAGSRCHQTWLLSSSEKLNSHENIIINWREYDSFEDSFMMEIAEILFRAKGTLCILQDILSSMSLI